MEVTKQGFVIAVSAAAVIAVFLIYIFIYMPLIRKLGITYSECRSCEGQVADARNTIGLAGKTNSDRILVAEKDTLFVIDELTKHGKEMGINFVSMRPGSIIDDSTAKYKIMPIDMEIEASDEQVSKFIGSLDDLKKAVIKVKSFDITPDEHDRTKVKAKMIVDMYLSKREYAE